VKRRFKVEVQKKFNSKEAALEVAKREAQGGSSVVTVFEEDSTDSGQCFRRIPIWSTKDNQDPRQVKDCGCHEP